MVELRDNQLTTLWMSGKDYAKEIIVPKHRHDFYQLQYLVSGSENLIIGDKPFTMKPNYLSIFDSNEYHEYSFNKRSRIVDIKFNMVSDLRTLLDDLFNKSVFLVEDMMIRNKFSQLTDQGIYFQKSEDRQILINIDTQVKLILLELAHSTAPEPMLISSEKCPDVDTDSNDPVALMTQYMFDNYSEKITLDILSQKFHYSKSQIINLFSDQKHQTPMYILQKIRLQYAKQLLSETGYSIGQIANEVGFNNNYFTKLFLKYEKQLPSEYRTAKQKELHEIILNTSFDITTQP